MKFHHRLILPAVLVAMAAFTWGCTRPSAALDQARSLEAKVAKLEQEVGAAAAARDALQRKLTETTSRLQQEEARAVAAETARDDARVSLKVRTTERDTIQVQYEAFRKNIRELVGQADTAAAQPVPSAPVSSVSLPLPAKNGL